MNEEALQYAYELFSKDGYKGSFEDYKSLIIDNDEALSYSYELFSKDGYKGSNEDFTNLLGVKKKDSPQLFLGESSPSPSQPIEFGERPVPARAEVDIEREQKQIDIVSSEASKIPLESADGVEIDLYTPLVNADRQIAYEKQLINWNPQQEGDVEWGPTNFSTDPNAHEIELARERTQQQERENETVTDYLRVSILEQLPEDVKNDPEKFAEVESELYARHGIAVDLTGDGRFNSGVSPGEAVVFSLGRGLVNLGATPQVLTAEVQESIFGNTFPTPTPFNPLGLSSDELKRERRSVLEELDKRISKSTQGFIEDLSQGNFSNASLTLGNTLAESAPEMALVAATGGGFAGYSILTASNAGRTYLDSEGQEFWEELSPVGKWGFAIGMGGFEAIGEMAGGRALKRAARGLASQTTRKASEQTLREFLSGYAKSAGISMTEEGLGEAITGVGQYVLEKAARGEDILLDELIHTAFESAAIGAASGGTIQTSATLASTPIYLASRYGSNGRRIRLDNKIAELRQEFESSTSEEERAVLADQITELHRAKVNAFYEDKAMFENFSDEDLNEYMEITEDIEQKSGRLSEIERDGSAKKALTSEIRDLQNRKSEIEEKYTQQQTQEEDVVQVSESTEVPSESETEGVQEAETEVREPNVETEEEVEIKPEDKKYAEDLKETKESNPEAYWSVDTVTEEDASKGTVIDTEDGAAVVGADGDIKGVFKKLKSKAKGVAQTLLKKAVEAGGTKLDNFVTGANGVKLQEIYEKAGFRVVSRTPFNEEFAPEGWTPKDGKPDVVAMVYDPNNELKFEERTFDSYDDMISYRDSILEGVDSQTEGISNLRDAFGGGSVRVQLPEQSDQTSKKPIKVLKKLKGIARKAEVALSKVAKGATILVADSEQQYNDFIDQLEVDEDLKSEYKEARAIYDPKNKVAYINPNAAVETTIVHEATHALMSEALGSFKRADKITNELWNTIKENADDPQLISDLEAFAEQYEKDGKLVMSSEALSELMGILSSSGDTLNQKQRSAVKKFFDEILNFLGFKRMSVDETFQLVNDLASRMASGDVITAQSIAPLKRTTIGESIKGNNTVENFAESVKPRLQGLFNVAYTVGDRVKNLIDKGIIRQEKNLFFIPKDATPTVTFPDSMFVGIVSIDGKEVFKGGGGMFYPINTGDVWASSEKAAKTMANSINAQFDNGQETAYLTLVKGSKKKLFSTVDGVSWSVSALEVMLDMGIISRTQMRSALINAAKSNNTSINIDKRSSANDISNAFKKLFKDPKSSTFSKRGNIVQSLIGELAKSIKDPSNVSKVIELLGGDSSKTQLAASLNDTKNGASLANMISNVVTEKMIRGLDTGDVYAVIEVKSRVSTEPSTHQSYDTTIKTLDGSQPNIVLVENTPKSDNVLIGANSGKPVVVAQASSMSAKINESIRQQKTNKGKGRPSIEEVKRYAKDNNIPDKDVATFLKELGYSDAEINKSTVPEETEGVSKQQKIPQYLYHATYKPLLPSIKKRGLDTSEAEIAWEDSEPGIVYLANDPYVAESYAETSEMVDDEWLDEIIILKVASKDLDLSKLNDDRNVRSDEPSDTFEYHGVIPWDVLTEAGKPSTQTTVPEETKRKLSKQQKIEDFARRVNRGKTKFTEEDLTFYAENEDAIDAEVVKQRKEAPKDASRIRSLAQKIAAEKEITEDDIDLYSRNEDAVKSQLREIGLTEERVNEVIPKLTKKDVPTKPKPNKVTMTDKAVVKQRIQDMVKAARDGYRQGRREIKDFGQSISNFFKESDIKGKLTPKQAVSLANRAAKVSTPKQLDNFLAYAERVIENVNYADQLAKVYSALKKAKGKLKRVDFGIDASQMSNALSVDPSKLSQEELDRYEEFLSKANKAPFNRTELSDDISFFESKYLEQKEEAAQEIEEDNSEESEQTESEAKKLAVESFEEATSDERVQVDEAYADDYEDMRSLSKEDLDNLSAREVAELTQLYENIKNGFHGSAKASKALRTAIASKAAKVAKETTSNKKYRNLLRDIFNPIKTESKKIEGYLRNMPLGRIDSIFKGDKGRQLYNSIIRPLSTAYSRFESLYNSDFRSLEKIIKKIPFKNRRIEMVKLSLISIARENALNPNNNEVTPIEDYIESIREEVKNNSNYRKEGQFYLDVYESMLDENGNFNYEEQLDRLSEPAKEYLSKADEIAIRNGKMVEVVAARNGEYVTVRQAYTPINVFQEETSLSEVEAKATRFTQNKDQISNVPKSGNVKARLKGGKALHLDFHTNVNRANKSILQDFYVREAVRRTASALSRVRSDKELSESQRDFFNALNNVLVDITKKQFINNNYDPDTTLRKIDQLLQKRGYQVALSGTARGSIEFASNFLHALTNNTTQLIDGLSFLENAKTAEGRENLRQLASFAKATQFERMFGKGSSIYLEQGAIPTDRVSQSASAAQEGAKRVGRAIDNFNDALMSYPDRAVAQPVWFGSFAQSFKNETGQNFNLNQFATNENYRSEFRNAILKAGNDADSQLTQSLATVNPFEGIEASMISKNDNVFSKFNKYMTRFTRAEYQSAVDAVDAMVGNNEMSFSDGMRLMGATVIRMAAYQMMNVMATNFILNAILGIDGEDDDLTKEARRGLVGTLINLIVMRRMGNIGKIPIAAGVEYLNSEYGDLVGLREEGKDYNKFDDSVVFNFVPVTKEDLATMDAAKFLPRVLGAYGAFTATTFRGIKAVNMALSASQEKTRDKYEKELIQRIMPELLMETVGLPAPRDLRQILLRDLFREYYEDGSSSTNTRVTPRSRTRSRNRSNRRE